MLSVNRPDTAAAGPPHIDTTAFFAPASSRGKVVTAELTADVRALSREEFRRQVDVAPLRVYNARLLDPPATLDRNGFQLARIDTAAGGHVGKEDFPAVCAAEGEAVVRALTGCVSARAFERLGGRPAAGMRNHRGKAGEGYTMRMHSDLSPYVELQPEWDPLVGDRHCAVLDVWRSMDFSGPIEQPPLAVCDARSIAPGDMVAARAISPRADRADFVTYNLAHNPFQRWYYYPDMAPDEVLVFRLYDTREERQSRRPVFHGAVFDPTRPPDARLRESYELRIAALFDEDTDREARRARYLAELPPMPDSALPRPVQAT